MAVVNSPRTTKEVGLNNIKIDEKPLEQAEFQEWAKSIDDKHPDNPAAAEMEKISALLHHSSKKMVLRMIAAGKNVPATKPVADNLEIGLLLMWAQNRREDDVFECLISDVGDVRTFLMSPFVNAWISDAKNTVENAYELLFKKIADQFSPGGLAQALRLAKEDAATKEIATILGELQLESWRKNKLTGNQVFKLLGLKAAGNKALENPVWGTWVSYLVKLAQDS